VEEGERRGRTLLYAAIIAAVVAGVVLYFVFARGKGAAAAPPAGGAPGASAQPTGSPAAPNTAPAAPAPGVPPAAGSPKAAKLDISGMVDQEVAKHEGEIRKQLEEKKKQLEKEIALAKAAGKQPPAAATSATTAAGTASGGAPVPATAPRPAVEMPVEPAKTEPAVQRQEIPAAKPEEPAAALPPPAAPEPRPAPAPAAPAVRTGDLVVGGPGVVSPELVSFSKPEYPPVARRMRVEGTVVVSVLVDENGRVEEAKLLTPITQDVGINEAAVRAARGAHYKPASKDGVKVKMWTRLKIPFKL
ncbi:MAG TPA: energy transducer TonB, partial [Thermoanaerobaculia bacterium]|nr:energy transducer TonB [Thermoanaerobaculia bacterium]